jgi:hypothetical protein
MHAVRQDLQGVKGVGNSINHTHSRHARESGHPVRRSTRD